MLQHFRLDFLPSWQEVPVYPPKHVQLNLFIRFTHFPPLTHGRLKHSSISKIWSLYWYINDIMLRLIGDFDCWIITLLSEMQPHSSNETMVFKFKSVILCTRVVYSLVSIVMQRLHWTLDEEICLLLGNKSVCRELFARSRWCQNLYNLLF